MPKGQRRPRGRRASQHRRMPPSSEQEPLSSLAPARNAHHRFLSSAALIAALSAITGLAVLGRESVTAHFFGRDDQIEAFLVAALLAVRHDRGQRSASDLTAAFLLGILGLVAAAIAVCALAFPLLLPLIARGFDGAKLELAQRLFYWLLPVVAIGAIGKFWLAVLNGYEHFVAGSLTPIVVPLSVIAFVVLAPDNARLEFLMYGVVAG